MENFKIIEARLRERQFSLKTTRCKEREIISDDENNSVETWKRPKRMNKFLRYSKFLTVDKNMIEQYEEELTTTTVCGDNNSQEYFEKCEPGRPMTETAADEILFRTGLTYPDGFPDLRKDINGYVIEAENFRTLMLFQSTEQYLDDNVINAFFSLLLGIAKGKNFSLVCFETHFCQSILTRGFVSVGYNKWANRNAVWDYPVWFIPINFAAHWTLMVIVHSRQSIIYLDSLHGNPDEKILNGIRHFI